jgi:hypothetical protein
MKANAVLNGEWAKHVRKQIKRATSKKRRRSWKREQRKAS